MSSSRGRLKYLQISQQSGLIQVHLCNLYMLGPRLSRLHTWPTQNGGNYLHKQKGVVLYSIAHKIIIFYDKDLQKYLYNIYRSLFMIIIYVDYKIFEKCKKIENIKCAFLSSVLICLFAKRKTFSFNQ